MGVKSKRDQLNFSLKATGKTKADDDEKKLDDKNSGETDTEDPENDRNESSENDEDVGAKAEDDLDDEKKEASSEDDDDDDDDDKETEATKKAISAFSRKNPSMYRAIMKRGARNERRRIASIEQLNIVGHNDLIHQAKYEKFLTAEQTSYAVLKAEQSLRSKLSDDYTSDASYRVPASTASVTNNTEAAAKKSLKSFLENVATGAKSVLTR